MSDQIEIKYVEFDGASPSYIEWTRNGEEQWSMNDGSDYDGASPEFPDDVRIALALAVAPGLVERSSTATPVIINEQSS